MDSRVDHLKNREWTADEHVAAVKVQKVWRGYFSRKLKTARTPGEPHFLAPPTWRGHDLCHLPCIPPKGTELNLKTQELLQKSYAVIEPNAESHGLALFRTMFKADPDLMPKYPFFLDEWNKISYADYQGSHPDQTVNTWFIVFRYVVPFQRNLSMG